MRIAIVAPSSPITQDTADRVTALAAAHYPKVELVFHPQCFLRHHHFAGPDAARADAFVQVANDPGFDAIWFARGGYGACRIAHNVLGRLNAAAREKSYMGYSDAGFLLAGLYAAGFKHVAHGPMVNDINRDGGNAAVERALLWTVSKGVDALEMTINGAASAAGKAIAFNITVFSQLLGTLLQPDLTGHVLMLEDVSEYMYRIDRSMFHITNNPYVQRVAGIRLGRCSDIIQNDPNFGESEEEIARHWCNHAGIPYLGRADIGHDSDNKVVPFGI
jgi:muramoyltetrapeptide carboxypeptidase